MSDERPVVIVCLAGLRDYPKPMANTEVYLDDPKQVKGLNWVINRHRESNEPRRVR